MASPLRIMVLNVDVGAGHRRAGEALCAAIEALRPTADMVTRADLEETRVQLARQDELLVRLAAGSETMRRVQNEWRRGVCLIHGVYRLRMDDGSWFTLDGSAPFEPEYTGSGFLATAEGHVVTNRHVVVPWAHEEPLQALLAAGMRPEFARLTVTFPGRESVEVPFDGIRTRSDLLDVAVVRVEAAAVEGVPVLPLEDPLAPGSPPPSYERAIVVGYPTGLNSLLVRADRALVEELQRRQATLRQVIDALASAGQIQPMVNQGGVSNVEERMLVYDAPTTQGGSGGPVFGDQGRVIAVNFAVQPDFHGANYGVPIRYVRELLPK